MLDLGNATAAAPELPKPPQTTTRFIGATVQQGSLHSNASARTYGGVDSVNSQTVDAKIAASEARGETKLVTAMGEVRAEFAKLNARLDAAPTKITIWGAALTIIAVVLAALSFGSQMFGQGFSASQIADQAAAKAVAAATRKPPP